MALFPELTEKMEMLLTDIIACLGHLPIEQRGYIFGFEGEEDMAWVANVANYIALECIKYSYDHDDPEYPLRHFLENVNDDSERMLQSRIMKYVLDHKKKEIQDCDVKFPPDHKFAVTDMNGIDKKLQGYRLTAMNFFEHQNIHDMDLIKAIVERRIVSSKKISNDRFQEMFKQYDDFVETLIERSKKSDEDMVFASLALFTLEWHYPIETFYYLSQIMEKEELQTVDREALGLICGRVAVQSQFGGGWVTNDSRMVKERMMVLPYLFGRETDDFVRDTMKSMIKEIIVVCTRHMECLITEEEGDLYKEWFRKESSMTDWASFFRYYNIFAIWQKKEWTRERIQHMRHLFDLILAPKN